MKANHSTAVAAPKGGRTGRPAPRFRKAKGAAKPIWEIFDEITRGIPEQELRRLPRDGAAQHDHYTYGWPKRKP